MRKGLLLLCFVLITAVAVALAGCSGAPAQEESVAEPEEKLVVYTSFYPLYDFTQKIGGDRVDVQMLVPAGVEPHDWEPGPQALARLSEAELLIVNGLGLEPWVEKIVQSLDGNVSVLIASGGIEPLKGYAHNDDDDDDHDDEEDEDDLPDPHVWLDPLLALHQAENIAAALIALDPDHREVYEENLAVFKSEIEALDAEFKEAFSNTSRHKFIVTHFSFAYLAERYGLEQIGISGLSPHAEPSPAQMKGIVDYAREYGIRYIFQEPLASERLANVLAEEIDAQILLINPLEGLTDEELAAGEDYFSIMRKNLAQLKIALTE